MKILYQKVEPGDGAFWVTGLASALLLGLEPWERKAKHRC